MESLIKNPIKLNEYETWLNNKSINPRTKRKIGKTNKMYRHLSELNINILYLNETIDNKDPISLNDFWIETENGKQIVHEDIDNLIFYKDSHNNIRCFEKESVEYMLGYNIKNHPITGEVLPEIIFKDIKSNTMIKEEDKSIYDLTLDVFQLFNNNSFFIDHTLFLNLDDDNLVKLYYEIKDFYKQNFTEEQKNNISNNIFILSKHQFDDKNLEEKQRYILENIKILLNVHIEEYKYMINYILIGGLSLVIPEIKHLYPDFSFAF